MEHKKDEDPAKSGLTVAAEFTVTAYYVPPEKLQPKPQEEDDKKGKGKKDKGKKGKDSKAQKSESAD
jgi:hypothetical protein